MLTIKPDAMSVNELWSLYERVESILSAKIKTEQLALESRLAVLNRSMNAVMPSAPDQLHRRSYPKVLPKYRNPSTSETWSGRGRQPRWLVTAIEAGRKADDFRIPETSTSRRPHRPRV